MIKPIIHFAHANGFPAKTYGRLFSLLENDFQIGYLERHAHDEKFPVGDNWNALKDELKAAIEANYSEKIIGLGHSLGGVLHLLVAAENPELYRQIILLDAPIISRLSSFGLRVLKRTNLIDGFTPSKITKFRRNLWATKREVYEHFKQKPKFARFDEDVLRDYAEHGTIETDHGFELFFDPQIEAAIYRTIPHTLPRLRGKLKIPLTFIGGTDSREAELAGLRFMRRNFAVNFETVAGSHLFPLEKPRETAEKIIANVKK